MFDNEIKNLFDKIALAYDRFYSRSWTNDLDIAEKKEERVAEFRKSLYVDNKMKYMRIASRNISPTCTGHTWGYIEKSTGEFCINAVPSARFKKSRGNIKDPSTWENIDWTGPTYLN